jgi:hypothetical protein
MHLRDFARSGYPPTLVSGGLVGDFCRFQRHFRG